ncbi:MAG: dethiobiotin synthase [Thermodesulfovibrionales bacterium]|nr:dethiobiotin synthase [Thermodesulfovibrionales bacterium]
MSKGFFITGTDTGVGKTVIAAGLIRAAYMLGVRACGMKPVETGCSRQGDVLIPADGSFLKKISRMEEAINRIVPYCFESPLSPMSASEIEGVRIDPLWVMHEFNELKKRYEFAVVEGIGGLLVPLKKGYFVLDMARDFGLPVVVVSRPSLGTINHTLLTVNYALREGLDVAGVIINYSNPPDGSLAEETNAYALRALLPVPLIGVMPYLDDMETETLERAVRKNLDLEVIRRYLSA